MIMVHHLNGIALLINISLISISNKVAALEFNEKLSPQKLSDTFDLCLNRSADCEVELDVPSTCITEIGVSTCPVVFFLHGSGGTNDWFGRTSGVHEYNMIGVYPNGDCRGWNTGPKDCNQCSWDDFQCEEDPDEGQFIAGIISIVRDLGAVGNIYVRGNSNGAALALRLAVNSGDELPIKGIIASVTQLLESPERSGPGVLNYNQPLSSNPPVSILSISGTADGLIPYEGGTSAVFGGDENFYFMSNEESNQRWANHNNCDIVPVVSTVSASLGDGTADYFQYLNCVDGVYVEHYKVFGAGHNAGGTDLDSKSSDEIAFDFIIKVENGSNNNVPSSSPIKCSQPTPSPIATKCDDDKDWHGKFNVIHTCSYVADDPDIRCNWENDNNVKATEACPVACNTCPPNETPTYPTTNPTTPTTPEITSSPIDTECVDDIEWHGKFNVIHTCDYVADDPDIRCNWKNDNNAKATEACPVACNTCPE